jgi:muramoyltetrapeptide carboxypeptidase
MNRRTFSATLLTATIGIPLGAGRKTARLQLPQRLHEGDQVGLITPASYIEDDGLQKAVTNLESLGLKVVMGKHLRKVYGSLAGTDQERLDDLHRMFANPAIRAVWCARGGYGTPQLLPYIDYKLIRKNPKVFVGYSDITALHCAFERHSHLLSFHGPLGSSTLTDYTRQHLRQTLFEGQPQQAIAVSNDQLKLAEEVTTYQPTVIRAGQAEGPLTGGNLSLLASLAGTAYAPDIRGRILFMEDIGEKPYRIARMLTTLRQAWPLEKVAGIALGVFSDCEAKPGSRSLTLLETLKDRLGDLPVPIIYGLSFGHIDDMSTLPIGLNARMNTTDRSLTLLNAAVI